MLIRVQTPRMRLRVILGHPERQSSDEMIYARSTRALRYNSDWRGRCSWERSRASLLHIAGAQPRDRNNGGLERESPACIHDKQSLVRFGFSQTATARRDDVKRRESGGNRFGRSSQ